LADFNNFWQVTSKKNDVNKYSPNTVATLVFYIDEFILGSVCVD